MLETLKGIDRDGLKLAYNVLAELALFVTIALAVALVIYAIVIRNKDEDYLAKARKLILGIVIGYAVSVISTIGVLMLTREIMGGLDMRFWLMFGLFALVAVGLAVEDEANVNQFKPLNWRMYLYSAILVAGIIAGALLGGKRTEYNAKTLTYGAVCISLSFALSYIKFFQLPQHGSVTFASMLPICLFSYMFGTRKGLIAGVVYGMLQFIQSPSFYEPMQAMLDYPIAFGAIGLAGIARNFKFLKGNVFAEFTVGSTIAILLRYFSHVISGYFVFSSWAMPGYTAVSWAFVYNLYTIVDLAIVLAVGLVALASKTVRRMLKTAERV